MLRFNPHLHEIVAIAPLLTTIDEHADIMGEFG